MSWSREENSEAQSQLVRIMAMLEKIPLFDNFPAQSLKLISYLCETGDFEDGDILLEAGDDPGLAMYVISGKVSLQPLKEARRVTTYAEGSFLGGLSLLGSLPSLFTLQAAGRTRILLFERDRFSTVLEQYPEVYAVLLANLLKQLRSWDQSLIDAEGDESVPEVGVTLL